MVTGTTASSGDHSIITGVTCLPVASCASCPRNSVWPGLGKAGARQHALGDRIGDHGGGFARHHVVDRAADRGDRRRRARMRPACRARAVTGRPSGTTGSARAKVAGRLRRRHFRDRHVEAERARAALEKIGVADQIEGRQIELGPPPPKRERQIRADAGRFADRQSQRLGLAHFALEFPRLWRLCIRSSPLCAALPGSGWLRARSGAGRFASFTSCCDRRLGLARLLVANREHLQALLRSSPAWSAGQPACCRADRAAALSQIGRGAGHRIAHRHVAQPRARISRPSLQLRKRLRSCSASRRLASTTAASIHRAPPR